MLEGRDWRKVGGAPLETIQKLKAIAPVALPESYLSLLTFSNGGEGPLPIQPLWFQLYSAETVIATETSGAFHEFFPKLFVIGGNGGGEAIALDLREDTPIPVVSFDMTNIDLAESVRPIARSFDAALELIGLG